MAKWQRHLKLGPEWNEALAGTKTVRELSATIAGRLEQLAPFGDPTLDEERDEIVTDFRELASDENTTDDDFDGVLERLYDWADTPLDTDWNGKKACWVER